MIPHQGEMHVHAQQVLLSMGISDVLEFGKYVPSDAEETGVAFRK